MIDADKARLRTEARARRRDLAADRGAAERAADVFIQENFYSSSCIIAAYIAMADELDPLPLMARLAGLGQALALPVVTARDKPLVFRAWRPGAPLESGPHGTRQPPEGDEVTPGLVIVPLLAFDATGHRLGYGGGYYDRTLAHVRRVADVLAVGYAYEGQRVAALPSHAGDQRLDVVVTDQRVYWFADKKDG